MKPTHSHLAWHETLELHEWVGAQSNALIIIDPILKTMYKQTIDTLTQNIMELLQFYPFYPLTPKAGRDDASAATAGELLGFAKSSIKNYAMAITETATPSLRKVFKKHLNGASIPMPRFSTTFMKEISILLTT
ncbi:UNVERIFIED_ORG: spore coat protein F [Bacillus sp. B2I3]|nr:spore coat protein F [Bacillus sp. B2I3]